MSAIHIASIVPALKSLDKLIHDSSDTNSLLLCLPSDPFVSLPADPPADGHCIGHLLATGSRSCSSVTHSSPSSTLSGNTIGIQ